MIITIACEEGLVQVIAEPFTIDGSNEKFCVHRSEIGNDFKYSASHCTTGFRIDGGDTINATIENATKKWKQTNEDRMKEYLRIAFAKRKQLEMKMFESAAE